MSLPSDFQKISWEPGFIHTSGGEDIIVPLSNTARMDRDYGETPMKKDESIESKLAKLCGGMAICCCCCCCLLITTANASRVDNSDNIQALTLPFSDVKDVTFDGWTEFYEESLALWQKEQICMNDYSKSEGMKTRSNN